MTVRRWIKIGRIHAVQVGREMRIPRAEIERPVSAQGSSVRSAS
jgi:excisionase family DNA binding protein